MYIKRIAILGLVALPLAGCLETDAERGLAGAAGGAVISEATGGSALTGAVVGGAGGVFCDDVGICRRSR